MTLVRLLLTLGFLPAFVLLVRGTGSRSRAFRGVVLVLGVGLAGIIINFPGLLDNSASQIGISSGADLTLYLLVIGLLTMAGYVFGKLRRLEHRMNRTVQQMAVLESALDQNKSSD
jgi:hypothetical protein